MASTLWHIILCAVMVAHIASVEFLVNTWQPPKENPEANAVPPRMGVDWRWNLGSEWSEVLDKPAHFALLNIKPGTADQIMCGIIVEIGVTASASQAAKGIQKRLRGLPELVDFRLMNPLTVKSGGIVWEQFEFTATSQDLPLHYIYRVYCSPSGSYTLSGWSLQSDFDQHKSEFIQAFDSLRILSK